MKCLVLLGVALILLFGCTGGSKYNTPEKGPSAGANGNAGGSGSGTSGDLGTPVNGAGGTSGSSGGSGSGTSDVFRIPLSEVSTQAKVYSEKIGLKDVKFFAVKGSDGKVHVAFDGCDVCGGKYGYRQVGEDMVCNKCGKHFKINEIGTQNTPGGCSPSYLNYEIKGDGIIISKAELEKGAYRF